MLCIGATIIILLTAIAALFALAVGFVIVLYALFALACLAVVGPIFVAALLLDSTRSYFFSWLGSVLNFLMLSLFAMLLVLVDRKSVVLGKSVSVRVVYGGRRI